MTLNLLSLHRRRKRGVLVGAFLVIISVGLAGSCEKSSAGAANSGVAVASLAESKRDHGELMVKDVASGTIIVRNEGNTPFRIVGTRQSCGCTTAVVAKGEINPGETSEIKYEMKANGPTKRSVQIHIRTEPATKEPLVFTAQATFLRALEFDETALAIETKYGQPIEHRVPLKPAKNIEGLQILSASTRARGFETAIEPGENGAATLVLRSKDKLAPGVRAAGVNVEYDYHGKGQEALQFRITVTSDIIVEPDTLQLKFANGAASETATVTVRNKQGTPFLVRAITPNRCAIEPVELPKEPAAEHKIPITFQAPTGRAPRRGWLDFDLGEAFGTARLAVVAPRLPGSAPSPARAAAAPGAGRGPGAQQAATPATAENTPGS